MMVLLYETLQEPQPLEPIIINAVRVVWEETTPSGEKLILYVTSTVYKTITLTRVDMSVDGKLISSKVVTQPPTQPGPPYTDIVTVSIPWILPFSPTGHIFEIVFYGDFPTISKACRFFKRNESLALLGITVGSIGTVGAVAFLRKGGRK